MGRWAVLPNGHVFVFGRGESTDQRRSSGGAGQSSRRALFFGLARMPRRLWTWVYVGYYAAGRPREPRGRVIARPCRHPCSARTARFAQRPRTSVPDGGGRSEETAHSTTWAGCHGSSLSRDFMAVDRLLSTPVRSLDGWCERASCIDLVKIDARAPTDALRECGRSRVACGSCEVLKGRCEGVSLASSRSVRFYLLTPQGPPRENRRPSAVAELPSRRAKRCQSRCCRAGPALSLSAVRPRNRLKRVREIWALPSSPGLPVSFYRRRPRAGPPGSTESRADRRHPGAARALPPRQPLPDPVPAARHAGGRHERLLHTDRSPDGLHSERGARARDRAAVRAGEPAAAGRGDRLPVLREDRDSAAAQRLRDSPARPRGHPRTARGRGTLRLVVQRRATR
jgi:hypothetical protein